jgi:hypothetical protein
MQVMLVDPSKGPQVGPECRAANLAKIFVTYMAG